MRMLVDGLGGLLRAQGALLGLIVLQVAVFIAQGFGPVDWYGPLMVTPSAVVAAWRDLLQGVATPADWQHFATLLSYAFLHADFSHLAGNMLYLWLFGALLVELLGWRWMLGIFMLTALGAAAIHVWIERETSVPMLGASGSVLGFMGAYLGLAVRWQLPDPHVWPMARPIPPAHLAVLAAAFVALDYAAIFGGSPENIAFGAHVGGFTTGLALTALVTPKPRLARIRAR